MLAPEQSWRLPGPDAGNPGLLATAADNHLDHEGVVRILRKRVNEPAPAVRRRRCGRDGSSGAIEIVNGLACPSSQRLPWQRMKLLELLRGKHRGKRRSTCGRIGCRGEREQLSNGQQRDDQ